MFTWRQGFVGCKSGGAITAKNMDGYIRVVVDRNHYTAHRLAWLYMTGEFPTFQIDHINGVRDDNRWWNLREATVQQNQANKNLKTPNATGYRGVQKTPAGNYRSAIRGVSGKKVHLGTFPTAIQAYNAFCAAKIKMHGDFAALNNGGSTEKSLEING